MAVTLKWFTDSPDAGDPSCICSLCNEVIPDDEMVLRYFDEDRNREMRAHDSCFDLINSLMTYVPHIEDDQGDWVYEIPQRLLNLSEAELAANKENDQ